MPISFFVSYRQPCIIKRIVSLLKRILTPLLNKLKAASYDFLDLWGSRTTSLTNHYVTKLLKGTCQQAVAYLHKKYGFLSVYLCFVFHQFLREISFSSLAAKCSIMFMNCSLIVPICYFDAGVMHSWFIRFYQRSFENNCLLLLETRLTKLVRLSETLLYICK